jgi:hypothetical protein
MVTIQVYSRSGGNAQKGVRVSVDAGIITGIYQKQTDGDGYAHFPDVSPGEYVYYVDGHEFKGRLQGVKVVYI